MQPTTLNLITAVDKERVKRNMSDRKFSIEVLGISPSYYCLLKAGKRRLAPNLAVFFMQKLPEITPEVTIFFMSQGNDGKNKKTLKKVGVKNNQRYLDASNPPTPPKKPSKNAVRG